MELTEILVAVKQPDIQKSTMFSEPMRETGRSGKSFSELLADISSENQLSENEGYKPVKTDEKSYTDEEKVLSSEEKTNRDEALKKSEETKKIKKSSQTDDEEKNEKSNRYDYNTLNLIKTENKKASDTRIDSKNIKDVGTVKAELLEKIEQSGDEERILSLSKSSRVTVKDDFEVLVVTDEELALESARNLSVENPLDFLNNVSLNENENVEIQINKKSLTDTSENVSKDKLKSKITVSDLRTEKNPELKNSDDIAEPKLKVTMTGNDSATVELNLQNSQNQINADISSSNSQVSSSEGSTFQAMLNNQIQEYASELVRAGNIVLKDNNKGTINLVLHPDDLGNVKMTLSLDGDKITGHIAVNTKEALEVFKNNAETLREAFMENGFENASFDVSFSNSSSQNQQFAEQNNDRQNLIFAKRNYDSLDSAQINDEFENLSEDFSEISKFGINIVA